MSAYVCRSCLVERVEAGQTFDVPRTALLLTGSVKSLLPLPASFSLAVQNPKRKSSAADLLWPSNISSTWDPDRADSSPGRRMSAPADVTGDSGDLGGLPQQQQLPVAHDVAVASVQLPHTPERSFAVSGHGQLGGHDAASSSASSASSTDAGMNGAPGTPFAKAAAASGAAGGSRHEAATAAEARSGRAHVEEVDSLQLVAPAELPPGEFKCLAQAMVLQVGYHCPHTPRSVDGVPDLEVSWTAVTHSVCT